MPDTAIRKLGKLALSMENLVSIQVVVLWFFQMSVATVTANRHSLAALSSPQQQYHSLSLSVKCFLLRRIHVCEFKLHYF